MKNTVCYITHKLNDKIIERYNKLRNQLSENKYDVILCINDYHSTNETNLESLPNNINYYHQTKEKIDKLKDLGYYIHNNLGHDFIWINLHLVYLDFYLNFKDKYNEFFFIEYDVVFNGNWNLLFDDIEKYPDVDFLASKFRKYFTRDDWWWYTEQDNNIKIPKENMWGSFNAFMKLSNRAFEYLEKKLKTNTGAFHECSIISYLKEGGFNCVSLWGGNHNEIKGLSGKYCDIECFDVDWHILIPVIEDNKLYHPVKC